MFISNLSSEQQSAFLSLAKQLIASDGNIAPAEKALLETIQQQMSEGVTASEVTIDTLSNVFSCKKSKASLLLELLGLAHADQEYHSTEKTFIKQLAEACDVSTNELQDMESWVVRQLALVNEANQFMED
jgi:uncharacterized tellurite resistance protein B-like protein